MMTRMSIGLKNATAIGAALASLALVLWTGEARAQWDPLNRGVALMSKVGTRCLEMGPDPDQSLSAMPCRPFVRQQFHIPLDYVPGDTKATFGVAYGSAWRCVLAMDHNRMPGDQVLSLTICYTNWPSNKWTFENGTIRLTYNGKCLTMPVDGITHVATDGSRVWRDGPIAPTLEPCSGSDNQVWYRLLYANYADLDAKPLRSVPANRVETVTPYPASAIASTKDGWGPMLDIWGSRMEFAPRAFAVIKTPPGADVPPLITSTDVTKPVQIAVDWAGVAAKASPDRAGCAPQPAGLAHWWPGEGAANDVKGGRHGSVGGGVTLAPGAVGLGLGFDGKGGHVALPGTWGGSPELTVTAWVNPAAQTQDFQAVVSSADYSAFHLQLAGVGNVAVYTDAGPIYLPIIPQAPTSVWRHVALSIRSGDTRLYVNGRELGRSAAAFSRIAPSTSLRIGGGFQGGRSFGGTIDEVQIYGRALTAEEVGRIYRAGGAGVCRH